MQLQALRSGSWQSYISLLEFQVPIIVGTDLYIVRWGTLFSLSDYILWSLQIFVVHGYQWLQSLVHELIYDHNFTRKESAFRYGWFFMFYFVSFMYNIDNFECMLDPRTRYPFQSDNWCLCWFCSFIFVFAYLHLLRRQFCLWDVHWRKLHFQLILWWSLPSNSFVST
jgi:hypothetical protein